MMIKNFKKIQATKTPKTNAYKKTNSLFPRSSQNNFAKSFSVAHKPISPKVKINAPKINLQFRVKSLLPKSSLNVQRTPLLKYNFNNYIQISSRKFTTPAFHKIQLGNTFSGLRKFSSITTQGELLNKLTGSDPIEVNAVYGKNAGKRLSAEEFRSALKSHWTEKSNLSEEQKDAKAYLESINYFEGMLNDFNPAKLGLTEMTPASHYIREHLLGLLHSNHHTQVDYEEDPVDPWFGTEEKPVRVPTVADSRYFGSDEDDGKFHAIRGFKKPTVLLDTAEVVSLQDIKGPIYGYGHH